MRCWIFFPIHLWSKWYFEKSMFSTWISERFLVIRKSCVLDNEWCSPSNEPPRAKTRHKGRDQSCQENHRSFLTEVFLPPCTVPEAWSGYLPMHVSAMDLLGKFPSLPMNLRLIWLLGKRSASSQSRSLAFYVSCRHLAHPQRSSSCSSCSRALSFMTVAFERSKVWSWAKHMARSLISRITTAPRTPTLAQTTRRSRHRSRRHLGAWQGSQTARSFSCDRRGISLAEIWSALASRPSIRKKWAGEGFCFSLITGSDLSRF